MKKYLVAIFTVLLALTLFSCSASPTAMKVGGSEIDASEYAYYLNYNRLNLDMLSSGPSVLNTDQLLKQAHEQTKEHIITAEIVRLKCRELGLELTDEQRDSIEDEKDQLIESFGGLSAYLDYLNDNALTDRLYDKLQENSYYYSMLYDYVTSGDGQEAQNDQQIRQFFSENYIKVRYIRFSADSEDGALMDVTVPEEVEKVYQSIKNGEITFDDALKTYNDDQIMIDNPGGLVISRGDGAITEYANDAFELQDGTVGGVYVYSDGYYILERQPADISYFDENREQISAAAADWAFGNYIAQEKEKINITVNGVCRRINFDNIDKYVK